MAWAVCPVCGAVVQDQGVHWSWHEDVARAAAFTAAVPVPDGVTGGSQWTGSPVLPTPGAPTVEESTNAGELRDRSVELFAAYPGAVAALDSYLANTEPTGTELYAQVRVLTSTVRAVLIAMKATARLLSRSLDSTD